MRITSEFSLLALLGHPVQHSLSPLFQNAALQKLGLPYVYLAFDVAPDDLKDALYGLKALGFRGANLTVPHKELAVNFMDSLHEHAALLEAVNTVVNENGKLVGYNTDVIGFMKALHKNGAQLEGREVLLLGAGGAARAVACALNEVKVTRIWVANRSWERARLFLEWSRKALTCPVESLSWTSLFEQPDKEPTFREIYAIINATALGLKGEEIPLPWGYLSGLHWVIDLVYGKKGTPLVKKAEEKNIRNFDGRDMLIFQGAESFRLFTGHQAPLDVMFGALES
ncbi:shikimate dehydrogenase [Thermatribacter velox]|jgi:shikimate dehydrogenase|uniref:Shikimate dehydrogenase (NADP(+)) n=1 Tax=Thermatribacter velox TaxID=3039681 RepID=A0ABZ2YAR3_9BACT